MLNKVISMLTQFRQSNSGCAWTKAQTFESLAPQTIEEAYELVEAAETNNADNLKSELGDILYHFLFYTLIAEEKNLFTLDQICQEVIEKHERRMPEVNDRESLDADQTNQHWQALKAKERKNLTSALDGVPLNFTALTRALKLQQRAASVGFDWQNPTQVLEKIEEEIEEVKTEIITGNQANIEAEIGDVFFTLVNLARHLNVDPEASLRQANRKFEHRFRQVENLAKENQLNFSKTNIPSILSLWDEVKKNEHSTD